MTFLSHDFPFQLFFIGCDFVPFYSRHRGLSASNSTSATKALSQHLPPPRQQLKQNLGDKNQMSSPFFSCYCLAGFHSQVQTTKPETYIKKYIIIIIIIIKRDITSIEVLLLQDCDPTKQQSSTGIGTSKGPGIFPSSFEYLWFYVQSLFRQF